MLTLPNDRRRTGKYIENREPPLEGKSIPEEKIIPKEERKKNDDYNTYEYSDDDKDLSDEEW